MALPDLVSITIVWDKDTEEIEIAYDFENISGYEALGLLMHALEIQKENCFSPSEEED